jgi:hypothetical protein
MNDEQKELQELVDFLNPDIEIYLGKMIKLDFDRDY